jgi:hypothetical protein
MASHTQNAINCLIHNIVGSIPGFISVLVYVIAAHHLNQRFCGDIFLMGFHAVSTLTQYFPRSRPNLTLLQINIISYGGIGIGAIFRNGMSYNEMMFPRTELQTIFNLAWVVYVIWMLSTTALKVAVFGFISTPSLLIFSRSWSVLC